MKKNSPLYECKQKEKKIKEDNAIDFWSKCFLSKEKNNTPDNVQLQTYIHNLEERVHQLEQAFGQNWKHVKDVDRKFRSRMRKLEQKELLSKMMQDDEKDGIYEEPFMRAKGMDNLSSLSPVKIAIRVENEQEFNELINIMHARGWKKRDTGNGNSTLDYNNIPDTNLVQFHDEYLFLNGIELEKGFIGDYQIIDFKTLNAILGG